MNGRSKSVLTGGAAAAATLAAAGAARVLCPAGCGACETCATSLVPLAGPALVVGAILGGGTWGRRARPPLKATDVVPGQRTETDLTEPPVR